MNLTLLLQVTAIKMGSCAICDADKVMQGLERSASASTLLAQPAAVRTHTHKGRGRAAEGNRGWGVRMEEKHTHALDTIQSHSEC